MSIGIRKIYDEHKRVQIDFPNPTLTTQDCKEECDVNYIIESYVKRGIVPPNQASYMDCTSVADYQTAMMIVAECKTNFETLPSKMRDEFKTVENYLDYISNKDNLKDCLDRGLIDKSTVDEETLKSLYTVSSSPLPVEEKQAEPQVQPE